MNLFNRNDKPGDVAAQPQTAPPRPVPVPAPAPESMAPAPKPEIVAAKPAETPKPAATFQPTPSRTGASMGSVISKALKITGELESTEDIQIDGQIDGDVRGVGVKIGQNAKVKGTVYGDEVELAGTVDGRIESKKVTLAGTARMTGDIFHQDIKIESGAYINGSLKPDMGKPDTRAEAKPVASKPASPSIVTPAPKENAAAAAHH
jgi:cytoskeletal protein CcmA (bactofilin family)